MNLSILIVNWNSKDYLKRCLESVRQTCGALSPQIVVVDGGSYDGCSEMIAHEFPEVELLQSKENIGFGRSNNLGCRKVTGEALMLLNPDTVLQPGAVFALLKNLVHLPAAGLIGARLLNSDGSLQFASVHPLPTAWNVAIDSEFLRRRWWNRNGPAPGAQAKEVEAVSGACMMLRADTFRKLGGFDCRYFMYAEDMDLCCKIRRSGLKIYHATQAQVIHHGGCSSRTQSSKYSVVMIREATRLYIQSNQGRGHARLFLLLMALSAGLRMLVLLLAWLPARGAKRVSTAVIIAKWWIVLRWSLGLESWAKAHFFYPDHTHSLSAVA